MSGWFGREATEHYLFFEQVSGGDGRQVWARDRRTGQLDDLFFLEHGQAQHLRALVPRVLVCPFPGCPCPEFASVVDGGARRDHFRHAFAPDAVEHRPAIEAVAYGGPLVRHWLRDTGFSAVALRQVSGNGDICAVVANGFGIGEVAVVIVGDELSTQDISAVEHAVASCDMVHWMLRGQEPLLARAGTGERLVSRFARLLSRRGESVSFLSYNDRLVAVPLGSVDVPFEVDVASIRDVVIDARGIHRVRRDLPSTVAEVDRWMRALIRPTTVRTLAKVFRRSDIEVFATARALSKGGLATMGPRPDGDWMLSLTSGGRWRERWLAHCGLSGSSPVSET